MIILDLEYYFSLYMTQSTIVTLNLVPEIPVYISNSEFNSWTPLNTSIFNFLINYNSYNNTTINYMFYQFSSTSEISSFFNNNTGLANRLNTMLSYTDIYVCSTNGNQNILNLTNNDTNILFELLSNKNSDLSSFTATNPIIQNFIMALSINNNTLQAIPTIDYSNTDPISQILLYTYITNKLQQLLNNPVTNLP